MLSSETCAILLHTLGQPQMSSSGKSLEMIGNEIYTGPGQLPCFHLYTVAGTRCGAFIKEFPHMYPLWNFEGPEYRDILFAGMCLRVNEGEVVIT